MFALVAVPASTQRWPWPYLIAPYLAVAGFMAVAHVRQVHRRGQTVAEAIAASRADRRRQAQQRLEYRARLRERSRHVAALPWLSDEQLSPGSLPGVVITPGAGVLRQHPGGYDVVLDDPGNRPIHVIGQLRRLTRLPLKEAKDLVEAAPVPVLRVPDMPMAQAARYILESAGATVSITGPVS